MVREQMLYTYPPNLQQAQKHRLANRIFKGVEKNPNCQDCPCCQRKIGVEDVDLSCCYDKIQLAFIGPGLPLFFTYVKNSIILLIILTLVFGGFCIYSNLNSTYCSYGSTNCDYNIFNTVSFANKINNTDFLSIQNYILLAFVLLNVIAFQFFRYNFRQVQEQCDDIVNSPSDYSIILRRLPSNIKKEDIQSMIQLRRTQLSQQQKQKTDNLKIDHIVMSYSLSEMTRIKGQNLQKFKQLIKQGKQKQFIPIPLPKLQQTAKLAVVIFSRQQSKQFFLHNAGIFQKLLQCLCTPCTPLSNYKVKGEKICIQRAPEPDDIVWENSKISMEGAIARKTLFNALGLLVLLSGGGAQYGFALLQAEMANSSYAQLFPIMNSIIITVFNFLIVQFLVLTSIRQRNQTLTQFNSVLTVKITMFQFLNTGIFVVLAQYFSDVLHFSITNMPTNICIVMLTNALSPNFSLWLLNYFEIIGKIFRYLVKSERSKVTQIQANAIWLGPPSQIPYKYAYVIKTIWLTAFYAPLTPVVVPISILGLVINYFLQKYLYGFVYSVPNMLSSMVNDGAIEMMQYFPLILSMGQYIIYLYLVKYDPTIIPELWSIPIYVSIGISILNLVLPMDQFNKFFKLNSDDHTPPKYEDIQNMLEVTYQMTNPAEQCKKTRKRDLFLINHIFGGTASAKSNKLNFQQIFGLNDTNRSMIKSPLINKNQMQNQGEDNFLKAMVDNSQPSQKINKATENKIQKQEISPFAAMMSKLGHKGTIQNPNKNNNTQTIKQNSNQFTKSVVKQNLNQLKKSVVKQNNSNQLKKSVVKQSLNQLKKTVVKQNSNSFKQPVANQNSSQLKRIVANQNSYKVENNYNQIKNDKSIVKQNSSKVNIQMVNQNYNKVNNQNIKQNFAKINNQVKTSNNNVASNLEIAKKKTNQNSYQMTRTNQNHIHPKIIKQAPIEVNNQLNKKSRFQVKNQNLNKNNNQTKDLNSNQVNDQTKNQNFNKINDENKNSNKINNETKNQNFNIINDETKNSSSNKFNDETKNLSLNKDNNQTKNIIQRQKKNRSQVVTQQPNKLGNQIIKLDQNKVKNQIIKSISNQTCQISKQNKIKINNLINQKQISKVFNVQNSNIASIQYVKSKPTNNENIQILSIKDKKCSNQNTQNRLKGLKAIEQKIQAQRNNFINENNQKTIYQAENAIINNNISVIQYEKNQKSIDLTANTTINNNISIMQYSRIQTQYIKNKIVKQQPKKSEQKKIVKPLIQSSKKETSTCIVPQITSKQKKVLTLQKKVTKQSQIAQKFKQFSQTIQKSNAKPQKVKQSKFINSVQKSDQARDQYIQELNQSMIESRLTQHQVAQSVRKSYIQKSSELAYTNKKFTKNSTIFTLKPEIQTLTTKGFPHVEIHVPTSNAKKTRKKDIQFINQIQKINKSKITVDIYQDKFLNQAKQ